MTLAIMQPTYLPWAGYFNLVARVSRFVLLNDVQFAKPSWQMRNRVLLQGQVKFLTVPTLGSRNQLISEVRLSPEPWRGKHQRLLEHAYGKHPHGPATLGVLLPVIADASIDRLQDLNAQLIRALAGALSISSDWLWASDLKASGQRSHRLLELLNALGERDYLSPPGSADYIAQDAVLGPAGVGVELQHFDPHPYPQRGSQTFVERLSVVDVMANLGFEGARAYVTRAPVPRSPSVPAAPPRPPGSRAPGLRA